MIFADIIIVMINVINELSFFIYKFIFMILQKYKNKSKIILQKPPFILHIFHVKKLIFHKEKRLFNKRKIKSHFAELKCNFNKIKCDFSELMSHFIVVLFTITYILSLLTAYFFINLCTFV